jgi:hypothetical protein
VAERLAQGIAREDSIRMPAYKSYFATAASAKKKWNLTELYAKTVCDVWELTELELGQTYKDNLQTEVQDFYQKQTYVDTAQKLKTITKSITADQFRKMIDLYRGTVVMRSLSGNTAKFRADYAMIWQPMRGRMSGNDKAAQEANAMTCANAFNNQYLQDEQVNYIQYLTGATKNPMALKPYVVQKAGKYTLQIWHKP